MAETVKEQSIVEVDGNTYRIAKILPVPMWHVVRRMTPMLKSIGDTLQQMRALGINTPRDLLEKAGGMEALEPLANALASMSDADSEFVISTCLGAVSREVVTAGQTAAWTSVRNRNGTMQYDDIEMPQMMLLTYHTLQENLGRFFRSPPSQPTAAPAAI